MNQDLRTQYQEQRTRTKLSSTIAIIGGGFAGTMTAVHLLCRSKTRLHIVLINSRYPLAKGIAYSSYSNRHLLNVAAKSMSAFPDKPDHFINWIKNHDNYGALDQQELPDMFLPRNIYGKYLKDVFDNAIRTRNENVSIEFVHDEAIDLELVDGRASISFSVSPPVVADKVLLAMGNHDPRDPDFKNETFLNHPRYLPNPWLNETVSHAEKEEQILIIGNGLTMVDVVLGLRERSFKGKIFSLSPHGFRILPHRKFEPYKGILEELRPPYRLNTMFRTFKKHVRQQRAKGLSAEAVVDAIRPLTQKIWQELNIKEKQRFMHSLRHMWGVARHRLPMEIHKIIQQQILDDKLEIIAGKINSLKTTDQHAVVEIQTRTGGNPVVINASRIINCTGPEADITKMKNQLIQNLVASKLILPGILKMGINATPDGRIIDENENVSDVLFTIGSQLKGVLWESTAVPELRVQAEKMAAMFFNE